MQQNIKIAFSSITVDAASETASAPIVTVDVGVAPPSPDIESELPPPPPIVADDDDDDDVAEASTALRNMAAPSSTGNDMSVYSARS